MFNPFRKKKNKVQEEAQEEFDKGKIILPTGLRDYEDYEEFKKKTSHLSKIQEKLVVIEHGK